MMNLLTQLGIQEVNGGASTGSDWWSTAVEEKLFVSNNPATQSVIAKVSSASERDYERVISTAQQTFLTWRQVPAPQRGELVRQLAEILRRKKDLLGSLVALEMGKIKAEGDGEVQEMIDIAEFAVGQSRMLYGKTMHSERPQHRMYEQWHPLGPIAIFSAFNFPVAVWSWNALLAVICGNTVVWKPSPKTPLCAIAVQHICNQVMQQAGVTGVFNLLVTNENSLAKKMVADKRLPLVSFTGSSAVGEKVATIVAKRMGRTLLECSGNNALIVDETANMNLVVPAVVFGAVGTAGQRCTSTRRLLVHESRYAELVAKLIAAYKQVKIGDPLDKAVLMGPLIDQAAVRAYQQALLDVKQQGGEILVGGEVLNGNFVQPTIAKANNDSVIVQSETFAPILYVMTFKTLDEALAIHNRVPQGLSSALFTESVKNAEYFLSAVGSDCGIANVNIGTSGAEIGGAFGGEKATGGGREAGSDAWQAYMRRQTNTINWSNALPLAQGIKFG